MGKEVIKASTTCETFKYDFLDDTVDNLDCILFTGDRLHDEPNEVAKLRAMLLRWSNQLDFISKVDEGVNTDGN